MFAHTHDGVHTHLDPFPLSISICVCFGSDLKTCICFCGTALMNNTQNVCIDIFAAVDIQYIGNYCAKMIMEDVEKKINAESLFVCSTTHHYDS